MWKVQRTLTNNTQMRLLLPPQIPKTKIKIEHIEFLLVNPPSYFQRLIDFTSLIVVSKDAHSFWNVTWKLTSLKMQEKQEKKHNKHFSLLQKNLVTKIIEKNGKNKTKRKKEVEKTMWEAFQNQECLIEFNLRKNLKQKTLESKNKLSHFFIHVKGLSIGFIV